MKLDPKVREGLLVKLYLKEAKMIQVVKELLVKLDPREMKVIVVLQQQKLILCLNYVNIFQSR